MKKRVVSVLLAVCMCFQMLPAAFADDSITSTVSEQSQEQESTTDGESLPSSGLLAEDESQALKDADELEEAQATATPVASEVPEDAESTQATATPIPTEVPENTEDIEATPTPMPEETSIPEAEMHGTLPAAKATPTVAPVAPQTATLAERPSEGATVIGSGECGKTSKDEVIWKEYSDGTLIIEGNGEMRDYDWASGDGMVNHPWSSQVKSLYISKGVTSIGKNDFYRLEALVNVVLPDGLVRINEMAFAGCCNLSSIELPVDLQYIGINCFASCSNLAEITLPISLESIGGAAFYNCTSLKSIAIPYGVTGLFGNTFQGCSSLTDVVIPNSVISIGEELFADCTSLKSIVLPDSIKSIGGYLFSGCTALTEVKFPQNITRLYDHMFYNCAGLTEIIIPDTVITIEEGAFKGCTALNDIIIPDTVAEIGESAFSNCTSLHSIVLPNRVSQVSDNTFDGCTNLTSVTLPDGMTNIGSRAFRECSALSNIKIPQSVKSLGQSVFMSCKNLKDINIPDGITAIAEYTFYACSNLEDVVLPKGITDIGFGAFQYCSALTSITIPNTVSTIQSYAFDGCNKLKDVYFMGSEAEWNGITISNNNSALSNAIIHYNYGNLDGANEPIDVSSYKVGTLDDVVWNSDGLSLARVMIDGVEYLATADVYISPLLKGEIVAYQVNENGEIGWCAGACEQSVQITEWNEENKVYLGTKSDLSVLGIQYYYCGDNFTDNFVMQDPQRLVGQTCTMVCVELPDDEPFTSNYLVLDAHTSELVCGTIRLFDPLSVEVFLEGQEGAYAVNPEDDALQTALSDLIGQEAILTMQDEVVTAALPITDAYYMDATAKGDSGSFTWENGKYSLATTNVRVEIRVPITGKYAELSEELRWRSIYVTDIQVELEDNDYIEVSQQPVLEEANELLVACEPVIYNIQLKLKNPNKEPSVSDPLPTLKITVKGEKDGTPIQDECSVQISVRNVDEENRRAEERRKAAEKAEQEAIREAEKAAEEAEETLGNLEEDARYMILPPELSTYFTDDQLQSLKISILTQIALANAPKQTWEEWVGDKVMQLLFKKVFKVSNPDLQAERSNIPMTFKGQTKDGEAIQVNVMCDLTDYTIKDNAFSFTATMDFQLALGEPHYVLKKISTPGMAVKADISAFADGAWSVAKAELQQGFNKAWGDDASKLVTPYLADATQEAVDKVAPYFIRDSLQKILQLYWKLRKNKDVEKLMFEALCVPSKLVAAHCPVDVYVYDANQTLVGSIENNEVTLTNDNISLWVENDSKYVQIYDDDYHIEYRATDQGTMDLEIYENISRNTPQRVIHFEDVLLETGLQYGSVLSVSDITAEPQSYRLVSNEGQTLEPDAIEQSDQLPLPDYILPVEDEALLNQTFAGNTIDVTELFELIAEDDASTYTLLDGGTGTGTLTEDGNLTVTKAGTFVIQVDTAATDTHTAGSAQATLTVNKERGNGTLQVTGSTYPAMVQPAVQDNLSGGSVTYYYNTMDSNQGGSLWTTDTVLDAGEYWMYAEIAATDLYESYTTSAVPFTVQQAVVDQLDLANLITAPVRGATPQTELTTSQFTGTILWSDTPTVFAPETVYTATVKLTAAPNYTLEGLKADSFQYAGAEVHYDPMANQLTIVFPATDGRQVQSFAVTGTPSKTTYDLGEAFDVAGLTMTVTYDDGTTETVTSGYRVEPATMAADTTQVVLSYGGVKAEPVTGLTVRENLVSIQPPQAITGLANGTEKTTEALGLPKTVKITTSRTQRAIAEADVTWNLDACSYDPAVESEQTFVVQGLVSLPQGMTNLQNVPLTVAVEVTVKAAESKPTEPENPGDTEEKTGTSNQPAGVNETPAPTASANAQSAADDTTKEEQNQSVTVPQTGDPTPITVLVILMAVSFVGILALSTKRKKDR